MANPDHPEKDAELLPDDHPEPAAKPGTQVVRGGEERLPGQVLAFPLNQRPIYPTMMIPLAIPAGRLADGVRAAIKDHRGFVGFFLTREALEDGGKFTSADLLRTGCIAKIAKHQDNDNGGISVFIQVVSRFVITEIAAEEPVPLVRGEAVRTPVDANDQHVRASALAIVTALKSLVQHNPLYADEMRLVLANFGSLEGPSRLADIAASLTTAKREELQSVLETFDILPRMAKVLELLAREETLSALKTQIAGQVEKKVQEHQRKFFLNEQLKSIKTELGLESDDKSLDIKRFKERLESKGEAVPAEVRQVCDEELRKLQLLDPASSEYAVVRTRLEWLTEMPWGVVTADALDLGAIRTGLDADHYGLEDVKNRIVEFCAVRALKADRGGGMIALVGPPGTGKTSIGASIAKHLGRRFFRFSLGGMRDEAEIKGHRRTYVGALPGKIVQALKRAGSMNPVILLDEIDKLGHGMHGDPASALLEVLDPEQNKDFLDHYLDVRVDLSQVLFICTANELGGIPEPLRDRMEVIRLAGYVEAEKAVIAKDYLIPRNRAAHGLQRKDLDIAAPAVRALIRDYAREAGVRQLDQSIAKLCRKIAVAKAEGRKVAARIDAPGLVKHLGKPLMRDDALTRRPIPGVVTGLAWTAMGGATLEIEAVASTAEKGGLTLTGQLGDVMKESASIARSYLIVHARRLGIAAKWFDQHQIHLHVPAGATPKDGPSAGITIATALRSLATGAPVRRKLGMTGELTLTGRVYPIGGVREKLVAARRSGLDLVLLPKANERDYDELPDLVKGGLEVRFVETLDEVLEIAFGKG